MNIELNIISLNYLDYLHRSYHSIELLMQDYISSNI